MLNDAALGLTMTQIGGLTSILPIAYGAINTTAMPRLTSLDTGAGCCSWAMSCELVGCEQMTRPVHASASAHHCAAGSWLKLHCMPHRTHLSQSCSKRCHTVAGFSKFISGVLGARASPRVILGGGLMATAVVNIGFGFGASYVWFLCFWALNGLLQARASSPIQGNCHKEQPGMEVPQ